ncbi:MAG: carboxylating nicotinate-nucleotide diphosphorylase [Gammaproteobacteria bacterium]|nr:carboxylating nicotinate-nucleotide diphosphorylase [Gammaproteobacteria bacterium]
MKTHNTLTQYITDTVDIALQEDIGDGDITAALIPAGAMSTAQIISREPATLCGKDWCNEVFRQLDGDIQINWQVSDGSQVLKNQVLCELQGSSRHLLTGERTALNFLQTLSGTASLSKRYAQAVQGTGAKVLDTRKTIPGLRIAQKYAVKCGGCYNHRLGLYDGVLIKENHIQATGSIAAAVSAIMQKAKSNNNTMLIEMEVESLMQLQQALDAGVKRVLLDNMSITDLKKAVKINQGRAKLEASGGINLDNIHSVALTGIDYISVGLLTKNVHAVDLSMRFIH